MEIIPDELGKQDIQQKVGQLLYRGWAIVDTKQHTVAAVRMAYMRELRKVKDVLGIQQQRIKAIPHKDDPTYVRLEVDKTTLGTIESGYKILNPPKKFNKFNQTGIGGSEDE